MGLGKDLIDFAADHLCNDLRFIRFARRARVDRTTVTQHGNPIADPKYFIQFVRDVNHRHAARPQPIQNAKQDFNFSVS